MQSSLSNILFLCSLGGNISCSSSSFFKSIFKGTIPNSCLKIQDISQNLPQSHESKLVRCSRLHSRSFGIVKIGSFRELLQAICHRCSFHSPCTGFTQQPPISHKLKSLKDGNLCLWSWILDVSCSENPEICINGEPQEPAKCSAFDEYMIYESD